MVRNNSPMSEATDRLLLAKKGHAKQDLHACDSNFLACSATLPAALDLAPEYCSELITAAASQVLPPLSSLQRETRCQQC